MNTKHTLAPPEVPTPFRGTNAGSPNCAAADAFASAAGGGA